MSLPKTTPRLCLGGHVRGRHAIEHAEPPVLPSPSPRKIFIEIRLQLLIAANPNPKTQTTKLVLSPKRFCRERTLKLNPNRDAPILKKSGSSIPKNSKNRTRRPNQFFQRFAVAIGRRPRIDRELWPARNSSNGRITRNRSELFESNRAPLAPPPLAPHSSCRLDPIFGRHRFLGVWIGPRRSPCNFGRINFCARLSQNRKLSKNRTRRNE